MNKKEILNKLIRKRKEAMKIHCNQLHSIDYHVKEWNCPVDGLDYAIMLLQGIHDKDFAKEKKE